MQLSGQSGTGISDQLTRSLVSVQAALNAAVAQATSSVPAWPQLDASGFHITQMSGSVLGWQSAGGWAHCA